MGKSEEPARAVPAGRPQLLLSGLDSLYVSYYLDLSKGALDFDELAYQKERVKEARGQEFGEIELGSERLALMPYGKHPYTFVLCNKWLEIRLGENMSPSCHVQFTSFCLWQTGIDGALKRFERWCASLKLVKKLSEVVARADWAFDYHLPAIDFSADDFVSRFRKDSIHRANGAVQTFTLGRSDFVLRVYDKVAETEEQSHKFWFFDLWARRDEVWRIEFQVRRDRLQEAGIDTLDDLCALQNDLLRELAANHTTLRQPGSDSNRARWPLHPLWRALLGDIDELPQTGLVRIIDAKATLNIRIYFLGRAVYGMLKGLTALLSEREQREPPMSIDGLLALLRSELRRHHNELIWRADVNKRLKALRLGQW